MATTATHPAARQAGDTTPATGDRAGNGRFAPGNRGGPGNPFARRAALLRKVLQDAVTPEDLQRICQRLVTQAILGDMPSIKILFAYVLGKVPEPVNPDTLDQEEVRMHLQNLSVGELQETAQTKAPPRVSLSVLRGMSVAHEENAGQALDTQTRAAERREEKAQKRREQRARRDDEQDEYPVVEIPDELLAAAIAHAATQGPPLPNGDNGDRPPLPNGDNGATAPSPNGDNGASPSGRKPSPFWRQAIFGAPKS